MIENERFMLDDAGEVIDLQTAKFIEYGEEIVECLNNLHEENQALKSSNMEYEDALGRLEEENEQLKPFVEYEKRQHKHWKRECLENIKEIAQLKREIVQLKGDVE